MVDINPFDWTYEAGRIVENGKNRFKLENQVRVSFPEEALKLMKEDGRNYARRFRCDKKVGIIDEEWYDQKTGTWI